MNSTSANYHARRTCNREWKCVNCGDRHKPTDRRCEAYKYNQEFKGVIAEECVSVYDTKEGLARQQVVEREEWRRIEDRSLVE